MSVPAVVGVFIQVIVLGEAELIVKLGFKSVFEYLSYHFLKYGFQVSDILCSISASNSRNFSLRSCFAARSSGLSLYLGIIITSDLLFLFYTVSEVYTISKEVSDFMKTRLNAVLEASICVVTGRYTHLFILPISFSYATFQEKYCFYARKACKS